MYDKILLYHGSEIDTSWKACESKYERLSDGGKNLLYENKNVGAFLAAWDNIYGTNRENEIDNLSRYLQIEHYEIDLFDKFFQRLKKLCQDYENDQLFRSQIREKGDLFNMKITRLTRDGKTINDENEIQAFYKVTIDRENLQFVAHCDKNLTFKFKFHDPNMSESDKHQLVNQYDANNYCAAKNSEEKLRGK